MFESSNLPRVSVKIGAEPPVTLVMGTPLMKVLPDTAPNGFPIVAALVNNDVTPLYHPVMTNAVVEPLTMADPHGWRVYRWTLSFVLAKAIYETFPGMACRVRHSFGPALYWTAQWPDPAPHRLAENVARIKETLRRIVEENQPITYETVAYEEAIERFRSVGEHDKANLLAHRNPPMVPMVRCGTFLDLCQGALAHRTGVLRSFDLLPHAEGFILHLPTQANPRQIEPLPPFDHLFGIYQEHAEWGRIMGLMNVGQLNQAILENNAHDFVMTAEALHEKKLARIADQIIMRQPRPRLILLAGPSSAGKTTTAKRLITQLRVLGLRPLLLSTDDYFVGDELNPRDAAGNLDYEHIESMDLPRLNGDVLALLAGREVRMRGFDFKAKQPFDRAETTRLPENGVIVMEGIHSLNPHLTDQIPREEKFLIYVSALTQLALDRNNRISTTDNRLLRRMVRDNQYRGHSALATLDRWPSVQRGEQRWIFPYQHLADAVFNSALDYELAVLKTYAVPLLDQIKPRDKAYAEARRLSGFLQNFIALSPDVAPGNSLLREYIGGSQLVY